MNLQTILNRIVHTIDTLSEWSGRGIAWLILVMVLLITYDVFMRYAFNRTQVALQELEWHLFALTFLLGAAYTLKYDDHVRVDVLSHWLTPRGRTWLNLLGGLFLLVPFCLLVIISAWPFMYNALIQGEGSPDPGGLPQRWILKAAIPLGFGLLLLQGIAEIVRNSLFLMRKPDRIP